MSFDVVILTPGESLTRHYVTSLVATIKTLTELNLTYQVGSSESSVVSYARELCWREVKGVACKKIFWIDSDISWSPDNFLGLLNKNQDIVSGLYLNQHGGVVGQPLGNKKVWLESADAEMDWVGFGFLCVSSEVAHTLDEPFLAENCYGEDIAFCKNARAAGFSVWLDPTIRVTHHKTIALTP